MLVSCRSFHKPLTADNVLHSLRGSCLCVGSCMACLRTAAAFSAVPFGSSSSRRASTRQKHPCSTARRRPHSCTVFIVILRPSAFSPITVDTSRAVDAFEGHGALGYEDDEEMRAVMEMGICMTVIRWGVVDSCQAPLLVSSSILSTVLSQSGPSTLTANLAYHSSLSSGSWIEEASQWTTVESGTDARRCMSNRNPSRMYGCLFNTSSHPRSFRHYHRVLPRTHYHHCAPAAHYHRGLHVSSRSSRPKDRISNSACHRG